MADAGKLPISTWNTEKLTRQHLHPDDQIYYPFIKSTKNVVHAAEKSGTVKRIVFTQAGAGLIDSEVGDTYGNNMEQVLDGTPLSSYPGRDLLTD
jgi:hypothetical protein